MIDGSCHISCYCLQCDEKNKKEERDILVGYKYLYGWNSLRFGNYIYLNIVDKLKMESSTAIAGKGCG